MAENEAVNEIVRSGAAGNGSTAGSYPCAIDLCRGSLVQPFNEEAGEFWTPRDAVRLMANLVFLPIEVEIRSGTELQKTPLVVKAEKDDGEDFDDARN